MKFHTSSNDSATDFGWESIAIPDKPALENLELKFSQAWETDQIYRFSKERARDKNPTNPRAGVYSIDTPPPTVSGSLHLGHLFSYTHTDTIARFRRMCGFEVFYPIGADDNGVPTERRVQNYYGVGCDPSMAYVPEFVPPAQSAKNAQGNKKVDEQVHISRPNFIELCNSLTIEDERAFEDLWRTLGLSVDWSSAYATIDDKSRRISQKAFLRLVAKDLVYHSTAPTLWDVDFRTAVSQAELEDREMPGAYHRLAFASASNPDQIVEIDTTRPELLAACVALVAHPDDARYAALFGSCVTTPLFEVEVPVYPHHLADPEKGTGIAMVCTFGDATDIVWWRDLGLETRTIIGRDGRLMPISWGDSNWISRNHSKAANCYEYLVGKKVNQARTEIVKLLQESGKLLGEPRPITHPVKFYEKGERPLEIVSSRQWFIKTLDMRDDLLRRGEELNWFPHYMVARYKSWVEGLNQDWNISRQRYFGVPFPVWYRLDENGEPDFENPIYADEGSLPVDPSTDRPQGFDESLRDKPGGFCADPDVMDTWATSSLTPQIAGCWEDDNELFEMVFPMDLRPQSHEIIRTWLFSTVVRSHIEHNCLPFRDVAISGWVLDPDRKKMSKSKGDVVTPMPLIEKYGADAVRYWASCAHPGVDTAVDEGKMKIGRRLATKVLNASRFSLSRITLWPEDDRASLSVHNIVNPLDRSLMFGLAKLIDETTSSFELYDHGRAIDRVESFFWNYCDNYLELVKARAYGTDCSQQDQLSALSALGVATSIMLRLFAPVMPFVADEVWGWFNHGSIHCAKWPETTEVSQSLLPEVRAELLELASWVLGSVRKAKSESKVSMTAQVARVVVTDQKARLDMLASIARDIESAGCLIAPIELVESEAGQEPAVLVELLI